MPLPYPTSHLNEVLVAPNEIPSRRPARVQVCGSALVATNQIVFQGDTWPIWFPVVVSAVMQVRFGQSRWGEGGEVLGGSRYCMGGRYRAGQYRGGE